MRAGVRRRRACGGSEMRGQGPAEGRKGEGAKVGSWDGEGKKEERGQEARSTWW